MVIQPKRQGQETGKEINQTHRHIDLKKLIDGLLNEALNVQP